MTLLQHFQVGYAGGSTSNINATSGSANFAGIVVCTSSIDFEKPSCKYFESKADLWIIDSGASNHMTFNRHALTNITKLPYPLLISLPNGYRVKVLEFGDVILSSDIVLHRVLHVPSFKYNLISVHSLAVHLRCIVFFSDALCLLQAPSVKRPQVIGSSKDSLYYLCSRCLKGKRTVLPSVVSTSYCNCIPAPQSVNSHESVSHTHSCHTPQSVNTSISSNKNEPSYVFDKYDVNSLWHNRLGHVPFVKMRGISSIPVKFTPGQPFICPALKAFVTMIENQFNTSIKTIRSDNGLEFTSPEALSFYQSKGIIHQKTCPYTPQQNGVVEKKHTYLLETARALMFQSKLPTKYWGECILTATYLINRLPTTYLNNKCPFELLYQKKPHYSHLRSFGCLCYPTLPKIHRDKFEPRTTPHIFVGYPFGTKGYKVLSLATRRIHISRDVIFHENVFPFSLSFENASFPAVLRTVSSPNYAEVSSQVLRMNLGQSPVSVTSPEIEHHSETSINDTPSPNTTDPPSTNDNNLQPSSTHVQSEAPFLRKSSRSHQTPAYLKDYVYQLPSSSAQLSTVTQHFTPSLKALFSNHHHITPDALSTESQHLMQKCLP
ncbi:PREDICTED: uncharacterized protein LOC109238613 [Nicotiana attenuata]|uniref:uncharacterized protein LOC109238613 n=1 Tax=Nicotiana attenuata TaxID=49451 RepID=UPI00090530BF|nr:PREDICTED: uncharacterized protein LOC109238613 [Nicotiana attenuata]